MLNTTLVSFSVFIFTHKSRAEQFFLPEHSSISSPRDSNIGVPSRSCGRLAGELYKYSSNSYIFPSFVLSFPALIQWLLKKRHPLSRLQPPTPSRRRVPLPRFRTPRVHLLWLPSPSLKLLPSNPVLRSSPYHPRNLLVCGLFSLSNSCTNQTCSCSQTIMAFPSIFFF